MAGRAPHFFEAMADHMGAAYLRYSFTKGTVKEVDFLVDALGLRPGHRVLDVGCGPGRHAHELARRGVEVVGVDVAARFVAIARRDAPPGARFVRGDARALPVACAFDAAISLCQGGFGLLGGRLDDEAAVIAGMAAAVRPGGAVALTAFSAYFAVRHLEEGESFDAATGVVAERTAVRDEVGVEAGFDLSTTCFTPRELRLLAARAGLAVEGVLASTPGAYGTGPPGLDCPEFLLLARRPAVEVPARDAGGSIASR